jgi:ferredoxin
MSYLPHIDFVACAAHGDCVAVAPQVFALEDLAVVVGDGPDDLILEAARACPSGAIIVIDAETGEQVPI